MHTKGLAYPAYRPGIMSLATALSYAIADRGGCHRRARPFVAEQTMKPLVIEGRSELVKTLYDERIPWHCALCCDLATCTIGLNFQDAAFMLSAVTGWNFTEDDMQALAERVASLIRSYNVREGASRDDDTLAPRCFQTEATDFAADRALTREMLDTMLDEYYALRGWDREGIPTPETLDKLDLGDVTRELQDLRKFRRAE